MSAQRRTVPVTGLPALTVLTVAGAADGPCVLVTGCVHGDEVTGLAACHALVDELPGSLRAGRVVLVPAVNVAGVVRGTRGVPPDGADLNRAFPGTGRSALVERLASALWSVIREESPDVLIDVHADATRAIPYALIDRAVRLRGQARATLDGRLVALAQSTGLTCVHDYPDALYEQFNLQRSLSGAVVNDLGIPALTIEAGPRRMIDRDAVAAGGHAVRGILATASMIEGASPAHDSRVAGAWRRAPAVKVPVAGWWDAALPAGARFEAGTVLGRVRAVDGEVLVDVRAEHEGLILSWSDTTWLAAGTAPGTFAVPEEA
jgi:predicted deacylase